jgi:brefeldin A-inhibited guanine nucleotide-exchange protein
MFHGSSFTPKFWMRVFDSVLLPMFDHVRAEVSGGVGGGWGRG